MRSRRLPESRRWLLSIAAIGLLAPLHGLSTATPAAALSATGDGQFTITDAVSAPEVADTLVIGLQFPESDSLGLPWFPTSASPTTCTESYAGGVAVLLIEDQPLPCSPANADATIGSGSSDRIVVDGYVLIPDDSSEISLQVSSAHPDTASLFVGLNYLYTSTSDDRSDLALRGGVIAQFGNATTISSAIEPNHSSSACTTPPAVAYRIYGYDKAVSYGFSLKWNVTGGSNDTGGFFQLIPPSHLSSLAGYDNDLDDSGTPDYQEADTDNDTIADWQEMGQATGGDTIDTDNDGTPDCADTDSDDGISDSDELGPDGDTDSDGDGIPDRLDAAGATITGTIYFDENLDGVQQRTEPDISNVAVDLVTAGLDSIFDTADDVVVATTVTQSPYRFTNVNDGRFLVKIDPATLPYAVYTTGESNQAVTVTNGVITAGSEPSFGEFYASVTGTLTNADNAPVANAVVAIVDADGNTLTATTDQTGRYVLQGSAFAPLVRGTATLTTSIDGSPEHRVIAIAGAQQSIVSISRSALLPVTGGSRTTGLIQAGVFAVLVGALLCRVQRRDVAALHLPRSAINNCSTVPIGKPRNVMK